MFNLFKDVLLNILLYEHSHFDKVEEGMSHLRETAPDHLNTIVDYFDTNYVKGPYRSVMVEGRLRFRRQPPRFPPAIWNVHDATIQGEARTNNACEAWNNGFKHLVGHSNPSLWSVITCLQKDNAIVETDVFRHTRGECIARRVRKGTLIHQKRMAKLCSKVASGSTSVVDFLEAVGRSIRLH